MRTSHPALWLAGVLAALLLAPTDLVAQGRTYTTIERGRYLVAAGDCAACHTNPGGKPFAGGLAMATPFGTIYSTNITPDPQTGIGKYSDADFYNAMHHGVRRDGALLYPAFPYPWFTKVGRADIRAMKAYLDTLEPVRQENRAPELPWPLSVRAAMRGWNALYLHEGEYVPRSDKSADWNRGAYLVEGLGHCGACHTDKNLLGAPKRDQRLEGGSFGERWYAPSLSGGLRSGLGGWTAAQIIEYLKSGANEHTTAAGPMADVVRHSTQHLDDADLQAIAVYLKALPAEHDESMAARESSASDSDRAALARGAALYLDNCTGCHMEDGDGLAGVFPALKGSSSIQAERGDTLAHIILAGAQAAKTSGRPTGLAMPAYGWKFDDQQVADLVNYIRNAWGNRAPRTNADEVAKVREEVEKAGS